MRKKRLKVNSVIFDMDGVITNTMPDHYRSWRAALKSEGIHVTYEDIYKREGQPGLISVRGIFTDYQELYDDQRGARILKKKEDIFKKMAKTRFIDGARTLVKQLHRNKFQLGLVTGTSRHELYRILPKRLRNLFSVIVTGNDVTHGKPDPEPYLKSLHDLKVRPADAVVIENAPFGIRSAKKAGLTCLALETSLPRKYLSEADAVFRSIKELQKRVLFLN